MKWIDKIRKIEYSKYCDLVSLLCPELDKEPPTGFTTPISELYPSGIRYYRRVINELDYLMTEPGIKDLICSLESSKIDLLEFVWRSLIKLELRVILVMRSMELEIPGWIDRVNVSLEWKKKIHSPEIVERMEWKNLYAEEFRKYNRFTRDLYSDTELMWCKKVAEEVGLVIKDSDFTVTIDSDKKITLGLDEFIIAYRGDFIKVIGEKEFGDYFLSVYLPKDRKDINIPTREAILTPKDIKSYTPSEIKYALYDEMGIIG